MKAPITKPISRWQAVIGLAVLWLAALGVNQAQCFASRGLDLPNLFGSVFIAIIFSPLVLPCAFLHVVCGYSDSTSPPWTGAFAWIFDLLLISLWITFVVTRWRWCFLISTVLLLISAAGCQSYVRTIHFE